VEAKIFESETYKIANNSFSRAGTYPVNLTSSAGCDSLVILHLDLYKVYRPNAFSPNGDGINDYFSILGEEDLIEIRSLQVFDKWGNLVYQARQLPPNQASSGWDGSSRGQAMANGIYVYSALLLMDDGVERQISGSLSLVR
jgi:gliding motility-associated-like protein